MGGTELLIVLLAVVVGSIAKAVTGMGLPIIAIPIAALFVDLDDAVVSIAVANVLANAVLGARELDRRDETRDLPMLAATGIVGAVVGTIAFVNLPEEPLVALLVVAIIGYVATFFLMPDLRVGPERSRRMAPGIGLLAGAFQGSIGISGPIVGSWIHSYRLGRGAHILSVTSLFLVTGLTQVVVFAVSGEFRGRLTASALATIPVLSAIPLGTRLRERVSVRGFDVAIVTMLVVSAVALGVQTFA